MGSGTRLGSGLLGGLLAMMAALAALPALAADSAVVFMYHRFGDGRYPSTNITLEQFEAHIRELTSGAYTVWPLARIVAHVRDGQPLPDRTVGISIDDAYLSVYTEAWPRLKAAGLPFTLFVSTDHADGKQGGGYMTWDQIRELSRAGVTIGHHTASHLHMPDADDARLRDEITQATARYEAELGLRPELFAYPYGEASLAVERLVRQAGFIGAFGQHSGAMGPQDDPHYLPRFALNEHYGDMDRFRLAANTIDLPATDLTPEDHLVTDANPPAVGFTVTPPMKGLGNITCYASGQGKVAATVLGDTRVEVRMTQAFPQGRTRVNCTLPAGQGRWYWLGRQFYVPH